MGHLRNASPDIVSQLINFLDFRVDFFEIGISAQETKNIA